jgi:hypothetical protein
VARIPVQSEALVLLRPDRYIAAASRAPAEIRQTLQRM